MTKGGRAKDGTTGISKEEREGTSSGKGQEASVIIENENVQPLPSCSSSVAHFQLDDNYEDHAALDDIPVNSESDGNDGDDDEYIMLPPSQGRIDPAVLASLPPSMQLNLLVQMREQLVTDNRKRFQKVAKDPAAFSQMQIQAYLKTVAFRRDIDQVQKAAANRGIGGLPSARIASEVDREYIFSANFQPKEPVAQTYEVERNVTHRFGEDILDASETSQSLGLHGKRMIQQDTTMSEAVSLKETMPDKKPADEHESVEDKEIDWEDGENFVSPAPSQPLKGTITIEIDQDEILADIRETQKFGGEGGSESEDIEWEDDALGGEHVNSIAEKSIPTTGLEYKSEDNSLNLGGNNHEALNETLREAEEAELEEAIRQSLQDYKSCKGQDSVVENELVVDLMEKNITSLNNNVSESPLSEKVYLASARERKGKVVVEDNKTMCQEGTCLQEIKEFTRKSSDSTELSDHDVNSCTVSLSEVNVAIPLGSRSHVDAKVVEAHANDSITGLQTSASVMDFNLMSGKSLCRDAPLSRINTTNDVQIETDCIMKSKATIVSPQLPNMGELRTEAPCFNNAVSRVGEFNKENKNGHDNEQLASSLQPSYDNLELVGMQTNTPVESEKIPSSFSVNCIGKEDEQLQEALLKEAEEININAEREALAQQERDLEVEREELSCQQAELQALIESEQAAIQARLQEERDLLLEEEIELRASQRKNERNAESVSGEMFSECQELLQMFGIPYIIAPMEAEAQCAYMDSIGLVDGVITDDCDVFLFGGRNVFKNIFDDRKYVETYYMKDVENELGLDQEKLIHMALLLGSDYTEGISGIGIVNAIEVVNSFEGEEGLQKFREWLDAPDVTLLEKINQDGPKKHAEKKTEQGNESQDNVNLQEVDGGGSQDSKYNSQQRIFMQKHRAVSKNWNFPESFPNPMVINAYKSPQVDTSSEAFTWGRPDLEVLRRLCLEKFGWDRSKSEELLLPVLKEYDRRETQLRLEAFYSFNERFAKIRSKRIQKAVTRKTGQLPSELVDFPVPENSEELISVEDERDCLSRENGADAKLKTFAKASAKNSVGIRRNKQKSNNIEEGVQEVSTHRRVAARGRSKTSRGRARPSVRSVSRLSVETLSSDGSSGQEETSGHKECKGKVPDSMPRRSNRQTQRVIYNYSGSEDDNDTDWKEELQTREQPHSFSSACTTGRKNAKESALFTGTNSVSETESTKDCGIGASMTGNFMTQEDESHVYTGGFSAADAHSKKAKSVLIASNRAAEAERNIGDSEILACSANDQQDFQGQEDTNYLSVGGGFCTNADDASLEKSSHAFAISGKTMEGFVDDNESMGLLEELQSSVRSLASSTSASTNVFSSASEDHLTREESALCAIPSLRRKKRRVT
ncbi:hypothetical protein KP509_23G005600 [Ceratopteris richardii]|nr:hypothetical protein KP509_23G005600 [Ceratopteris richardii]